MYACIHVCDIDTRPLHTQTTYANGIYATTPLFKVQGDRELVSAAEHANMWEERWCMR